LTASDSIGVLTLRGNRSERGLVEDDDAPSCARDGLARGDVAVDPL
jgi:hypothetical protein